GDGPRADDRRGPYDGAPGGRRRPARGRDSAGLVGRRRSAGGAQEPPARGVLGLRLTRRAAARGTVAAGGGHEGPRRWREQALRIAPRGQQGARLRRRIIPIGGREG